MPLPALAGDPPSDCRARPAAPLPWGGPSPRVKCYAQRPFGFTMASPVHFPRDPNGNTIRAMALLFGKNIGWTDVEYEVRAANGLQLHAER